MTITWRYTQKRWPMQKLREKYRSFYRRLMMPNRQLATIIRRAYATDLTGRREY